jgi:DNA-binding XRE family transcriptional regulator
MAGLRQAEASVSRLLLDGRRYVVLPEQTYLELLDAAGGAPVPDPAGWAAWEKDAATLGRRLAERRRQAGLTQGALASAAEIRVETLNRIERGKTSPDFGTVRRLVLALAGVRRGTTRPARRSRS